MSLTVKYFLIIFAVFLIFIVALGLFIIFWRNAKLSYFDKEIETLNNCFMNAKNEYNSTLKRLKKLNLKQTIYFDNLQKLFEINNKINELKDDFDEYKFFVLDLINKKKIFSLLKEKNKIRNYHENYEEINIDYKDVTGEINKYWNTIENVANVSFSALNLLREYLTSNKKKLINSYEYCFNQLNKLFNLTNQIENDKIEKNISNVAILISENEKRINLFCEKVDKLKKMEYTITTLLDQKLNNLKQLNISMHKINYLESQIISLKNLWVQENHNRTIKVIKDILNGIYSIEYKLYVEEKYINYWKMQIKLLSNIEEKIQKFTKIRQFLTEEQFNDLYSLLTSVYNHISLIYRQKHINLDDAYSLKKSFNDIRNIIDNTNKYIANSFAEKIVLENKKNIDFIYNNIILWMQDNYHLIENNNANFNLLISVQNEIKNKNNDAYDKNIFLDNLIHLFSKIFKDYLYVNMIKSIYDKYVFEYVNNDKFIIIKDVIDKNIATKKYDFAFNSLVKFIKRR
ncbi:hypothetical protein [Mycoplasmopsis meleagridis]|uniref:hypothetical protein n=1 Tax=Mycoplasmopsis meleagridis TaxID=29561 RepID=UPI00073D7719|nr:hypothetical protein [Mycoplasmopsis meleagridis]KUH47437.1 hypothetical protein ASB56_01025 [Mycoplasmopsis meleagridis]